MMEIFSNPMFLAVAGVVVLLLVISFVRNKSGQSASNADSASHAQDASLPDELVAAIAGAVCVQPKIDMGISEEVIAVISAAVAAMGGGYTLRSVKRAKPARSAWATAGLMQNTQPF